MTLVRVARFSDRHAADIARLHLASEGIESVVFDGGMASLGLGMMTPARLMVDDSDEARARSILGRDEDEAP